MTYMGSGDPARRRNDYYPRWLDKLADDVALEASAMNESYKDDAIWELMYLGHAREL